MTALLRALFLDPAFRADKSSLVAGRSSTSSVSSGRSARPPPRDRQARRAALLGTLDALGQVPFRPPSVGGWPGGVAWLSTAATEQRLTFAGAMARPADLSAVDRRPRTGPRPPRACSGSTAGPPAPWPHSRRRPPTRPGW